MASHRYTPEQRDEITGARKNFRKSLRKMGDYLIGGDWVVTDRSVTFFGENGMSSHRDNLGTLKFKPLRNGNLKAVTIINHAKDNYIFRRDYIVSLNPSTETFVAAMRATKGSHVITGSIDRKHNLIHWTDTGLAEGGSFDGGNYIRSINFLNIA